MTDFAGQVAVVTGAGSGIGQGDRAGTRRQGKCYPADVTSDEAVAWLAAAVIRDFGRLDFLIHSAGVFASGPLETVSIDDLDRQYRTNVRTPYRLTQVLLTMLKASQGQIVFINSSVGLSSATVNGGQYAATKYALRAVADSLHAEVNALCVRVLSVYHDVTP
jgi:NAD(P)-dependent dehydrogenase (short-subunit alcohol dehydrogenase family)